MESSAIIPSEDLSLSLIFCFVLIAISSCHYDHQRKFCHIQPSNYIEYPNNEIKEERLFPSSSALSLNIITCLEKIQITSFFSLPLVKELGVSKYDVDWKYADVVFLLLQQMVFISFSLFFFFFLVSLCFAFSSLSLSNRIQFLDHLTYIDSVDAARFCFSPLQFFFSHT